MRNRRHTILLLVLAGLASASCRREALAPAAEPPPNVRIGRQTAAAPETNKNASLAFRTIPGKPQAGAETRLELEIRDDASLAFDPIAGKPIHFFVVNRQMTWNEHLHPEGASGSFAASVRFPADGEYVLYSIFKRSGRTQEVSSWTIQVGTRREAVMAPVSSERQKQIGDYGVAFRIDPERPVIGTWTSLVFTITRNGRPVTNLTPTGTLGHIIILREGAVDFAYAHSTDGEAVGGVRGRAHAPAQPNPERHDRHVGDTGPEITFHTRFPKAGRYKMWAQFKAGDDIIEPDFTVDVAELPPIFGSSAQRP